MLHFKVFLWSDAAPRQVNVLKGGALEDFPSLGTGMRHSLEGWKGDAMLLQVQSAAHLLGPTHL